MMNPEHGNSLDLEIECPDEPLHVWRIGFSPELWAWTPWTFAGDDGLFSGRWDDQLGEFRTIYTAESLLGCLFELLAHFRPSPELAAGLDQMIDDDGSIGSYPEAPQCAIGYYGWKTGGTVLHAKAANTATSPTHAVLPR